MSSSLFIVDARDGGGFHDDRRGGGGSDRFDRRDEYYGSRYNRDDRYEHVPMYMYVLIYRNETFS